MCELDQEVVRNGTFGHLAPQNGKSYQGYMLFAWSEYGDITLIRAHFDGLNDSPWLFDDMNTFITSETRDEGQIYLFRGHYRRQDGKGEFVGTVTQVDIDI